MGRNQRGLVSAVMAIIIADAPEGWNSRDIKADNRNPTSSDTGVTVHRPGTGLFFGPPWAEKSACPLRPRGTVPVNGYDTGQQVPRRSTNY